MKKLLFILIAIGVLSVLALHLYYNIYKHGYEDKKYGFLFLDTRGWTILEPKEGVYMSLGTTENNIVISYVGISPVSKNVNKDKSAETIQKLCNETISETKGEYKSFSNITIGGLAGYACNYKTKGTNTNNMLNVSSIILFGKAPENYDYIISTSFPKGNSDEQRKIETLISNFQAN